MSGTAKPFPQDQEPNEYRYLSATWLDALATGLTQGAAKHPGETWRTIPADEHLARAMRHINLWRGGDRQEPHIVNASMRLMMAFETAKEHNGKTAPMTNNRKPPKFGVAVLPEPCVNVPEKTVKEWFAKIDEELNEFKESILFATSTPLDTEITKMIIPNDGTIDCMADEAADTITAITSMLEAMGITLGMRQEAQRRVNEKNRERGKL